MGYGRKAEIHYFAATRIELLSDVHEEPGHQAITPFDVLAKAILSKNSRGDGI